MCYNILDLGELSSVTVWKRLAQDSNEIRVLVKEPQRAIGASEDVQNGLVPVSSFEKLIHVTAPIKNFIIALSSIYE